MSGEGQTADPDLLRPVMLQYLDGTLPADDVAELSSELRGNPALREELAQLLLEHACLAELRNEKAWAAPRPAIQPGGRRKSVARRLWLSAAAVAGIVLLGWLFVPSRYPAPQISQSVQVVGGGKPQRGADLRTGRQPGRLELGGYCRLQIEPNTTIRIQGDKRDESILLKTGGVTCEVNRQGGGFVVRTEVGTVSVTGTKFSVRILGSEEEAAAKTRPALKVAVMAGSVHVEYDGRTYDLSAGSTRAFGAEGERESSGVARGRQIEAGKPTYRLKNHEAWQDQARIVGPLRNAPLCEIDVLDSLGEIVASTGVKKGEASYELQWLKPGVYTLRVSAKGYETLEVKELEVKTRHDLVVGLEF